MKTSNYLFSIIMIALSTLAITSCGSEDSDPKPIVPEVPSDTTEVPSDTTELPTQTQLEAIKANVIGIEYQMFKAIVDGVTIEDLCAPTPASAAPYVEDMSLTFYDETKVIYDNNCDGSSSATYDDNENLVSISTTYSVEVDGDKITITVKAGTVAIMVGKFLITDLVDSNNEPLAEIKGTFEAGPANNRKQTTVFLKRN